MSNEPAKRIARVIESSARATVEQWLEHPTFRSDASEMVGAIANNAAQVLLGEALGLMLDAVDSLDLYYVTVHRFGGKSSASIQCRTDAEARDVAALIGAPMPSREFHEREGLEWISVTVSNERSRVSVSGPHRAMAGKPQSGT